jgi:Arc/MetJ-type ribon-helix-helix transcriptional regulator
MSPYSKGMEVRLTSQQEESIRRAVETGRIRSQEDALQEALSLWEERERKRAEFLSTLDDAKASLARGEGRIVTEESMRELAQAVKQRGLARVAAEQQTQR